MVELADTVVLETTALGREGSTPSFGTNCSPVAQWQRQRSQKPCSVGSNPTRATRLLRCGVTAAREVLNLAGLGSSPSAVANVLGDSSVVERQVETLGVGGAIPPLPTKYCSTGSGTERVSKTL